MLLKAIFYLVFILLLLFAYVRFLEYSSVFYPSTQIAATPKDIGLVYENITFRTEDGEDINAWLSKSHSNAPTLVLCHGNAGNMGDRLEKINGLHGLGVNVFIFDYRGYGASTGRPTEKGVYTDVLGAFDYLLSRDDLDHNKIVSFGVSLGGAVAVELAARRPVAALILDSTFSCGEDMGKIIAPFVPTFLFNVEFASTEKIKTITVPKLIFHSPQDEVVPYKLGKKLFEAAPEPKKFVDVEGSHNDAFTISRMTYLKNINDFLENHGLK